MNRGLAWLSTRLFNPAIGRLLGIGAAFVGTLLLYGTAMSQNKPQTPNPGEITIYGSISLKEAAPHVRAYKIFKDHQVCGIDLREIPVIKNNGDALLDAVVYIENAPEGKPFPAAARKVTINQKRCFFEPYLSVVAQGGEIEVINSDPVLHNIHVYEKAGGTERSVFNVSQPMRGDITRHVIKSTGNMLHLTCDAHNFMLGYVFVAKSPYYAVVDNEGQYRITGLPAGTYTVTVWHGILGEQSETVTVPSGSLAHVSFTY